MRFTVKSDDRETPVSFEKKEVSLKDWWFGDRLSGSRRAPAGAVG